MRVAVARARRQRGRRHQGRHDSFSLGGLAREVGHVRVAGQRREVRLEGAEQLRVQRGAVGGAVGRRGDVRLAEQTRVGHDAAEQQRSQRRAQGGGEGSAGDVRVAVDGRWVRGGARATGLLRRDDPGGDGEARGARRPRRVAPRARGRVQTTRLKYVDKY